MELIIIAIIIWFSHYLGYRMGGGTKIDLVPQKLKAIIRNEAQELELENKLKAKR